MTGQGRGEDEKEQGAGQVTPDFIIDPSEAAFEASRAELDALRGKRLTPLRVDVYSASVVARSVAVRDAAPPRRDAFERLSLGGFYDLATLPRLERLSRAVWYAREQQRFHEAVASEARVRNEVVREARTRRAGMQRVLDYWFRKRPDAATEPAEGVTSRPDLTIELSYLRGAVRHIDLANDLHALARLYERDDIQAVLARYDPSYRETDATEARRLAHTIFDGLGVRAERQSQRWASLTHRAFTLLARTYETHKRSGTYAFGESEDTSRTYPTLVTAVRARARRGQRKLGASAASGRRVRGEKKSCRLPAVASVYKLVERPKSAWCQGVRPLRDVEVAWLVGEIVGRGAAVTLAVDCCFARRDARPLAPPPKERGGRR